MKISLNRCYGLFGLSTFGVNKLMENGIDPFDFDRKDKDFIILVERYGTRLFDKESRVEIFEIPDNTTDYDILTHDGYETLVYVVDGKIKYI